MDETTEIVELLSDLLSGQNGAPLALFMAAPPNTRRPFSVYILAGSEELETLEGNVSGAGYMMNMATFGRSALEAQQEAQRIRRLIEGEQRAPSGTAMRVDFDDEMATAARRVDGPADIEFVWSADYTIFVGD